MGEPQEMQQEPKSLEESHPSTPASPQYAFVLLPFSLASVLGLLFLPSGSPWLPRAPQRAQAAVTNLFTCCFLSPHGSSFQGTPGHSNHNKGLSALWAPHLYSPW